MPTEGSARRRIERVVSYLFGTPIVPAIVAAVLGLHRIGEKSVWLDEAFSIDVTRLSTPQMVLYLARHEWDKSPYYALLQPWTTLGIGEAEVRSLSVVFGVVAVLATYAIGRRFEVAWPAALLLAVAPAFVQYEQEARAYTLLIAVAALSSLAWLRLTERPDRGRSLAYVVSAALIIYVHPLGAFVPVAHGVATLALVDHALRRRLLALFVPVVLAWLPMVGFAILRHDKIAWIQPLTATTLSGDLLVLAGGGVVAGALLVLIALGARRDMLLSWLVVPIVGTIAISLLIQPAMNAKFLLGVLPAAALIAARNRPLAVAVLVALSLAGVANWYDHGRKDDWRAGAAWVSERVRPEDGMVFVTANMREPFGYYAQVGRPLYPSQAWGTVFLPGLGAHLDTITLPEVQRIWLVQGHGRDAPATVWQALEPFTVAEEVDFGGSGPFIQLLVRSTS